MDLGGSSRKRRIIDVTDEERDQSKGHRFENTKINGSVVHLGDNHINIESLLKHPTGLENAERKANLQIFDILHESLRFDRYEDRLNNVAPALVQTCEWLFKHEHFIAWNDVQQQPVHHGFLWIKGKPGSGKSTLMKQVVENARQVQPGAFIVSYFFNARATNDLEKSPSGMYRSIVYQILEQSEYELKAAFARRFKSKIGQQTRKVWTDIELQNAIVDIMKMSTGHSLVILIDALDEGTDNAVAEMVAFLQDTALRAVNMAFDLRIGLSSRHYPHICINNGLELVLENQPEHMQDIAHYVLTKLPSHREDKELDDLRDQIFRKSRGIFLWVVIVVRLLKQQLSRGESVQEAQQRLEGIPTGLHNLFVSIMGRDSEGITDSVLLFQFVLFSGADLHPLVLHGAINWARKRRAGHNEASIRQPSEEALLLWLLNCSRGLLEVKATSASHDMGYLCLPSTAVQFIHESVRDFLLSRDGLIALQPELADNLRGRSLDALKRCCWEKATQTPFRKARRQANMPRDRLRYTDKFLNYAVHTVFWYANAADGCGVSQSTFLDDLLADEQRLYKRWTQMKAILDNIDEMCTLPDLLTFLIQHCVNVWRIYFDRLADAVSVAKQHFCKAQSRTI